MHPVAALLRALAQAKIPFLVVGGSAAVLQGAPFLTLDVNLWIGLPARAYMRVINLCQALGARLHSPSAVILPREHIINFLYAVTGLNSFRYEARLAREAVWHGVPVRILPVDRI